ncbi:MULTISPECIES: ParA family protein [unclassified Marinobacter]|uniref:ParA family protein n=1 Tax=unclassified Marinobacter TaxID=83889 RepID=UPI000BF5A54B|nr:MULTISPECIES: ParA family protein [unclassified Marinobacter]PFG10612.1 chromosome partitioning protein [Marinobacter sp. LV10MA510-1]PFG52531.1 chromosome partitioning protein [Marinobacter sp. LV10R520-4]
MARVIAVTNQKGGVGKTTTCVNLAASLAATKRRVLLVDMDPQGNATMGSGIDKNALQLSGYDLLTKRASASEIIIYNEIGGYDIMPGNGDLTAAEVELMAEIGREHRLRQALNPLRDNYDYVLIDCPPSLNLLTVNALSFADSILIPMQCEYYALEGLAALMNTVQQIQETVNPNLQVEGILRTMYDPRSSLTRDVSGQLTEFFGDKVYRVVIPRNVRLAEAPSHGMPALKYDKASKGAIAYLALAGEMVRRHGAKKASDAVAV